MANVELFLELVDLDSQPEILLANEQFNINFRFKDLVNNNQAVFSGYADVIFDASFFRAEEIIYGSAYSASQTGTIDNNIGLIDEVGAVAFQTNPPNNNLIFTVKFTALQDLTNNDTTITTDAGENDFSQIVIFGTSSDQRNETNFGSLSLKNDVVNTNPTISNINDIVIEQGQSTGNIPFTISDNQTSADSLNITVSSSNENLVSPDQILLGGTGENRTINITANNDRTGETNITVTVSDGELTNSDSFLFAVAPPNLIIGNLTFGGAAANIITVTNSPEINRLYGGGNKDILTAGTNDRLFGGTGNDTFDATSDGGDNRLYGGEGDDIFILGKDDLLAGGKGADSFRVTGDILPTDNVIIDWETEDKFLIDANFGANLDAFSDLQLLSENSNTRIIATNFDNQEIALVLGVTLTESNFMFV